MLDCLVCDDGQKFGSGVCSNGHLLSIQLSSGHGCDVCKSSIEEGVEMRSCRECDYDQHASCGDADALCVCSRCNVHKDKHTKKEGSRYKKSVAPVLHFLNIA